MPLIIRQSLKIIGFALFLLSIAYVIYFVVENRRSINDIPEFQFRIIIVSALIYATTHISSSFAWIILVRSIGQPMSFRQGLSISMTAQIGKYLPGNIAHYFARAGLAKKEGVTISSSGVATISEIMGTLLAGSLTAYLTLIFLHKPLVAFTPELAKYGNTLSWFPLVWILGVALLVRLFKIPPVALATAIACLTTSFVLIGLSFFSLLPSAALLQTEISPLIAISFFAIAWTAGYVIPGAPAGLGVREAILVAWLGPILGGSAALACVVLHRVITACVDGVVSLIGYVWLRHERRSV